MLYGPEMPGAVCRIWADRLTAPYRAATASRLGRYPEPRISTPVAVSGRIRGHPRRLSDPSPSSTRPMQRNTGIPSP